MILTEKKGNQMADRESISDAGKNLLWYPLADVTASKMSTVASYPNKYPMGAVIHYTSGRSKQGDYDARNTVAYGSKSGHCYFCISSSGTVFQTFPLSEWGYHAGLSHHRNIPDKRSNPDVSSYLVGIEICCAGKLFKQSDGTFESWFGEKYSKDEVRYVPEKNNVKEGYYHKYTKAQEEALEQLLIWLHHNNTTFELSNVFGHDEVKSTKSDPGGSLSVTMPEFRERLVRKCNPHLVVPNIHPIIKMSSLSLPEVKSLQEYLNTTFGSNLVEDGVAGEKTSTVFYKIFGTYLEGDRRNETDRI